MARTRFLLAVVSVLTLVSVQPAAADFMMLWSDDSFHIPATATIPMAVGDMNGDDILEMVGRFGGNATEVRDAMTGTVIKTFPSYSLASGYAMVDLDGDGTPECIGSGDASKTFVIDWVLVTGAPEPAPAPAVQSSGLDIRPNPGGARTEIAFSLPSGADGELRVYDASGKSVRVLADRLFDAGDQSIAWDGTDEGGARLSPGVYFVELRINDGALSRKGRIVLK